MRRFILTLVFVLIGISLAALPAAAQQPSTCTVTPSGTFANVRAQPSTSAAQVATIYPGQPFTVSGVNSVGDWYRIEPGWVFSGVVTTSGACTGLPVDNSVAQPSTAPTAAPAVPAGPPSTICPADFAGYLSPRLSVGANGAVISDRFSNVLRNEPSLQGGYAGEIRPGQNFVVEDGPACSQGYVWWFARVGDVAGWTPESSFFEQVYYLAPQTAPPPPPPAQPTTAPAVVNPAPQPTVAPAVINPAPTQPGSISPGLPPTTQLDTNVWPCPANFTGYMPTRLAVGQTSTLISPRFANLIRISPSLVGGYIGEVNPGETFTVVDGPACNEGFVWWVIAVRDVTGWSPESAFEGEEYYMQPGTGSAAPVNPPLPAPTIPVPTAAVPPAGGSTQINAPIISATTLLTDSAGLMRPAISPDGQLVALATPDLMGLTLWDLATGAPVIEITATSRVWGAYFHPTLPLLAYHTDDSIVFWDYQAQVENSVISPEAVVSNGLALTFNPDWSAFATVNCADQTPNGCALGEAAVWSVAEGGITETFQTPGDAVRQVALHPDGATMLTLGTLRVNIWSIEPPQWLRLIDLTGIAEGVTLSLDGSLAAVYGCARVQSSSGLALCVEGGLSIYSVATGELVQALTVGSNPVNDARFSTAVFSVDSALVLAAVGSDIQLWDAIGGVLVDTFTVHEFPVVAFAQYQSLIVSVDADRNAYVWDLNADAG